MKTAWPPSRAVPPRTPTQLRRLRILAAAAGEVRAALADPIGLVATRLDARVTGLELLTEGVTGAGSASYVPHPSFAVASAVIALDPELLLPGVGTIPSETISALLVHAPTVEALLVGANAALAAELRWREYPTDPGATFLKSFWNASTEDIPDVSTWKKDLGKHLYAASGDNLLVFLVRGEIVSRYPDARYYLVKAMWEGNTREAVAQDKPGEPVDPEKRRDLVFTGSVDALTRYFAFAITADRARGSPDPDDNDPGLVLCHRAGAHRAPLRPRRVWDRRKRDHDVEQPLLGRHGAERRDVGIAHPCHRQGRAHGGDARGAHLGFGRCTDGWHHHATASAGLPACQRYAAQGDRQCRLILL